MMMVACLRVGTRCRRRCCCGNGGGHPLTHCEGVVRMSTTTTGKGGVHCTPDLVQQTLGGERACAPRARKKMINVRSAITLVCSTPSLHARGGIHPTTTFHSTLTHITCRLHHHPNRFLIDLF